VPVDKNEGLGQHQRFHGQGVGRGNADGDKALPCAAHVRGSRADIFEGPGRQMHHALDGRRANDRLKESRGVRNHRDCAGVLIFAPDSFLAERGQQVGNRKALRGQNAVHRIQRKLTLAVQEIGEVGLPETSLPGQERYAERAALDPAKQFQAEALVHLAKVHLWKICRPQWANDPIAISWKTYQGVCPFIVGICLAVEKPVTGNMRPGVDGKESFTYIRFT
jgi:hypothetical protein